MNEVSNEWEATGCSAKNSRISPDDSTWPAPSRRLYLCVFFLMSMQLFVENDPSMATHSQPVLKKAPPSTERPMPKGFYSDREPQRIGTGPVQPPPPTTPRPGAAQPEGLSLPLAATPMTPSHPPRPPVEALPKYAPIETSQGANKHPLEPPPQQGPPNKHVRHKAFPYGI